MFDEKQEKIAHLVLVTESKSGAPTVEKAEYIFAPTYTVMLEHGHRRIFPD